MSYWDIEYPNSFYTNLPFYTFPIYNNYMSYTTSTTPISIQNDKDKNVTIIPIMHDNYNNCACTLDESPYDCFIKRKYKCVKD